MCGAACKKLTFRVQFVEIDGALPSAGERALRSLEGVLVEPGVRLDDSEFGVAVPSANLKIEHYSMLFGATVLAGVMNICSYVFTSNDGY